MRIRAIGFAGMAAALLCAGTVVAAPIPLSQLLEEGATIQSGDKVFSDFGYTATGDMPSADGVTVEARQYENGDYGLRFQGGFVDTAGGDPSDALITFNVSVAEGSPLSIGGAILRANPAVFGGTGFANVTETFVPTIIDDKLLVYEFEDGTDLLEDSIQFAQGYKTLPVQKDILLYATGETGAVTVSFVDQIFPQVPEPSSLMLALAGLLGLSWARRRMA